MWILSIQLLKGRLMKPTSYPSAFLLVRADPIEKYEFSVNTDSQKQIIEYLLDTGVSYAQEIAKADETEAYEESSKGNIGRYLKRWKEEGLLKRGYLAEGASNTTGLTFSLHLLPSIYPSIIRTV